MATRPSKILETFANPSPQRDYWVRMKIPEFTCLCPLTGQPDFATMVLDFVPDKRNVELKSLKLYMWSYRNEGAFHEAVTNAILDDLVKAIAPRFMRLTAEWYVRGGIFTTVTAEHRKKGWKPAAYVQVREESPGSSTRESALNPDLDRLQPYPFERLRQLFAGIEPAADLAPINLSIGEPKHPTPPFILDAYAKALSGIASYPLTAGVPELREAIAAWATRRYQLKALDPSTQVLPVTGTREALFSFAQTVIDRTRDARVVAPNPFYQIYEGAALLAGAKPIYLPTTADDGFRMRFETLTPAEWRNVQLVYVCSPGNPTGHVMTLDEWKQLFELSDRYGFVIASDECYSEIYFEEGKAPLGSLQAAAELGRDTYERLVMFCSLSKRSSVPGMRSGFVAGDAERAAKIPAVSHVSRHRDERRSTTCEHRRLEG